MSRTYYLGNRVCAKTGDITAESTDAIVNAANRSLAGGGGVDGAIHRAGGPEILAECRRIREERFPRGLPTGEAVITGAGRLPASFVIHTVGPVYGGEGGSEANLLSLCYQNCILLAERHKLETLSFPSISTGVFGYPKDSAAGIASRAITTALNSVTSVQRINLVFFSESDLQKFSDHSKF